MPGDMSPCVSILLSMCFSLSCCVSCVSVHRYSQPDIISKTKVELPAVLIPCALSDIIIISAPIVKNAQYYLHNPIGDAIKLNISKPTYPETEKAVNNEYDEYSFHSIGDIVIKYSKKGKSISNIENFKVYNLGSNVWETTDIFTEFTRNLSRNDFIIGPLIEEDHGNWVLSAYTKGEDGEWIELFQVITIEIKEYIQPKPRMAKLRKGDTFEFSFAHPLPNITSCSLIAPRSTFDRFYERDYIKMDTCGYVIKNITKQDQGTWRIMAVGRIVYGTRLYLEVLDCHKCKSELL